MTQAPAEISRFLHGGKGGSSGDDKEDVESVALGGLLSEGKGRKDEEAVVSERGKRERGRTDDGMCQGVVLLWAGM